MSKKPTNGVLNVDTKQMEDMRTQVVEQELSARSWKAYYEKMYFSLEAEKLEPEYAKYKVRMAERVEKEKKEYAEFMEKMQKEMANINVGNPLGEVKVEPSKETAILEKKKEAPVIQMSK